LAGEIVVEGEVERVTFENPDTSFRVVKIAVAGRAERLTVVGAFPAVVVGARVRVRGRIETDKRHGEQLRADAVTELAPSTLVGIERYLGSGMIKGVGEKYAQRIVARFGLDTLRVLDEAPERLREVEGLGAKRIESIARAWSEQRAIREVMVFLQAKGASPALATRIFRRYGARSIAVVSSEPYRLALEVWGIGFKTADRIAAELGIARDSQQRMEAGLLQAVHDVTESGHTYAREDELTVRAAQLLGLEEADAREPMRRAVGALAVAGYVAIEEVQGTRILFASEMHAAETRLARRLVELAHAAARPVGGAERAIAAFEARAQVTLAPEQRAAVEEAARSQVMVITGGPGVGKTTIVRAVLAVLDGAGIGVRLAAPTGRAAKRMSESSGREASTLHRLLEFDPKRSVFKRDREHPIEAGAVVVDEASMLDVALADALTQAIEPGTRLVLVGDVDQLPSVGPGAVLRDLIESRTVACVRLTQIFRQAAKSLIVTNAHRINSGEEPVAPPPGDTTADFFVVDRRDPEHARSTILELVTKRIPHRFGLDPVRDVQVLTPMHRGPAGSLALNDALQAALNPSGHTLTRGARSFRVGDKVMQLRNDYDKGVFNGDVGVVSRIDEEEEELFVGFSDAPFDREVAYEASDLDQLTLAYACSVHKSQGSEYPAVVVPLLTTHFVMLSRNLLYTAVTRGKRLVVLVCDPRALRLALSEDRRGERHTRLAARLRDGTVALGR
jgi:exodeoxyribonuclease V alpha subunit